MKSSSGSCWVGVGVGVGAGAGAGCAGRAESGTKKENMVLSMTSVRCSPGSPVLVLVSTRLAMAWADSGTTGVPMASALADAAFISVAGAVA